MLSIYLSALFMAFPSITAAQDPSCSGTPKCCESIAREDTDVSSLIGLNIGFECK